MPWSPSISMGITEPPHSTENPAQNAIRGSEELMGCTGVVMLTFRRKREHE